MSRQDIGREKTLPARRMERQGAQQAGDAVCNSSGVRGVNGVPA
jgi:hypothetical protein